jgi:hypothetical protein
MTGMQVELLQWMRPGLALQVIRLWNVRSLHVQMQHARGFTLMDSRLVAENEVLFRSQAREAPSNE